MGQYDRDPGVEDCICQSCSAVIQPTSVMYGEDACEVCAGIFSRSIRHMTFGDDFVHLGKWYRVHTQTPEGTLALEIGKKGCASDGTSALFIHEEK